jgi:hypothetical protein
MGDDTVSISVTGLEEDQHRVRRGGDGFASARRSLLGSERRAGATSASAPRMSLFRDRHLEARSRMVREAGRLMTAMDTTQLLVFLHVHGQKKRGKTIGLDHVMRER